MTRDEARQLLGGYSTGTLTKAEQKALFAAALEDQELFDELAGEQALKEVLNEPGARQRLLAALESGPHRSGWWARPWPWAAAATTLAIAIIAVRLSQNQAPAPLPQVAQVMKSAEPVVPAVQPVPEIAQRKVAPAPVPKPSAAPAPEPLVDKVQEADARARGGAAEPAMAALRGAIANAQSAFAFTYAVGADGFLEIVPAALGFLSVTTNDGVIFPSAAVAAGTPVRIPIPAVAARLVIGFSGTPGVAGSPVRLDQTSGTVTDQDPPNARIIVTIPATR